MQRKKNNSIDLKSSPTSFLIANLRSERLAVVAVIVFMGISVLFTLAQSGVIANLMTFTFNVDSIERNLPLEEPSRPSPQGDDNLAPNIPPDAPLNSPSGISPGERPADYPPGLIEKIKTTLTILLADGNQAATKFIVSSGDIFFMVTLGVLVFLFISTTQFLFFCKDFAIHYLSVRLMANLRKNLFDAYLKMRVDIFRSEKSGDLVARTLVDVERIGLNLREFLEGVVYGTILSIAGFAVMFYLNSTLTLILLVAAVVLAYAVHLSSQQLRTIVKALQQKISDISHYIQQTIYGIDIIKVYGRERWEKRRFDTYVARHLDTGVKEALLFQLIRPLSEIIGILGIIFIFLYASFLIWQEKLALETLINFLIILMYIIPYLQKLTKAVFFKEQILVSTTRLLESIALPKEDYLEDYQGKKTKNLRHFTGRLELRRVEFKYQQHTSPQKAESSSTKSPTVLNNIDLTIDPGKTYAIVGSSGSGKSTLLSLIPLLLKPTRGTIFYDGIPHTELSLRTVRSHIALVTQESILLSGSVRENVRYGRIEASNAEVAHAIKLAHLNPLIRKLPKGLDTEIGERGTKLSGGERQRLSLARAILKDPRILLLDEATSALDTKTERLIQDTIERMSKNRTTIVVAHRLSTIRRADKIAVLEKGRIVEMGTHASLAKSGKVYRQLIAAMK